VVFSFSTFSKGELGYLFVDCKKWLGYAKKAKIENHKKRILNISRNNI
jgi:hypothetical protein